ncbi:MAG TPA: nucleoside deaminase [Burkholderiales bacterium]
MASDWLGMAIDLARRNVARGARPFASVIVRDDRLVATGVNDVLATGDPTKHAEIEAVRAAAAALGTPQLDGCVVYASGHPCPMCLAAIHISGIKEVYYAYSLEDAERCGFSSAGLYAQMAKPPSQQSIRVVHTPVRASGESPYELWRRAKGSA